MRLTEMRQLLAARDIRLTKSLGQNFLHDTNQLRRIVAAAELSKADRVLEIGPGLGPLTELLVEEAGEVLAIEKDGRLVEVLEQAYGGERQSTALRILHDDALDYLSREPRDWSEWKLVANLPYSVASPILVELAQAVRGPQRMVATLQIEVAKRLVAKAGTADYGLLTLLVHLDYEPQGWFKIPATCFFPEPDVDSACVCLVRREPPLLPPEQRDTFTRIVKRSFSQRRKMMFKLLKADWPELRLAAEFERLQLSPRIRAEEVGLEHFVQLAQALLRSSP
ncbi:MAG: 16S rRNA (adenine(1518)-N(6)/adenine(1519)-N(6))-dimethyltransferase RsmA [Verrucomicrobia bacterium]|nr:16S rRNA (adenine(1518)-N(6)/adenine(1519)-N(6))-dimethyltransferase RsmA [Verrucomicrobiota bacterium]